ncbi:MAG TPA: peptide deformylase [Aggregatilineales bacterium]|nr:peptide deformylase [Aggregatilineales bacterium]
MNQLSIVTTSLEMAHIPALCLRQKAVDVPASVTPATIRELAEAMLFCLYSAGGVGLAAPQVGVGWRLFLAMERGVETPPLVLINPCFVDLSDEVVEGREGCLSLPGYVSLKVPRSARVRVEALNQFLDPVRIEASDFLARVIQHEYDHLDGILYIDRLKSPDDLEIQTVQSRTRKAVDELFAVSDGHPVAPDL